METRQNTLRDKLLQECGRVAWTELEPHCRRGALVHVDGVLDLIEVAVRIAEDDTGTVKQWLRQNQLRAIDQSQTTEWALENPTFWAVVVAPWVLIQKETDRQ